MLGYIFGQRFAQQLARRFPLLFRKCLYNRVESKCFCDLPGWQLAFHCAAWVEARRLLMLLTELGPARACLCAERLEPNKLWRKHIICHICAQVYRILAQPYKFASQFRGAQTICTISAEADESWRSGCFGTPLRPAQYLWGFIKLGGPFFVGPPCDLHTICGASAQSEVPV